MKKILKKLATVLSAILIFNMVFCEMTLPVKAATTECAVSFSVTVDGQAANNYGLNITQMENESSPIPSGASSSLSAKAENSYSVNENINLDSSATHIRFQFQAAGHTVTAVKINNVSLSADEITAMTGNDGLVKELAQVLAAETTSISVEVEVSGGSTPPVGPGEDDPPAPAPENPETITVTVTNYKDNFFTTENNITIDNVNAKSGSVTVEQAANHTISLQMEFGAALSSITVNDESYTPTAGDESWYSVIVPDASAYTITLVEGVSDDITIVWAYDHDDAVSKYGNDDAWVENGTVELVSIKRGDSVIYDAETGNPSDFGISEDGGDVALKRGDDVILKLVPNYGYQLKSVSINDDDELVPEENVSTFKISNLQGNIHFKGVFESATDVVSENSEFVTGASIGNAQNAADSGNVKLTVSDSESYTTDVTSAVSGDEVTWLASLDLELENIVSKGTADSYWTSTLSSFENNVDVELGVDFSQLAEGEEFGVVRDHEGNLEELTVSQDSENGKISFSTNQFSTYTIVKKGNAAPQGDFVCTNDINGEDMTFNPESLSNGFSNCVGDVGLAYFGRVNNDGEVEPVALLKENGYELADGVQIKYSSDNTSWNDAVYSVAFSEWDGLEDADIRIHGEEAEGFYSVAFCRLGFYRIICDEKVVTIDTFDKMITFTHDQQSNYFYNVYIYDDNDSFTITPKAEVQYYDIYIDARFGYGADGNEDNYFFTAKNGSGANVTNSLYYIHNEDSLAYVEEQDDPVEFSNTTVTLKTTSFATSYASIYIKYKLTNGEIYTDSYYVNYKDIGIRDDDSKRHKFNYNASTAQAFECYAISPEEYRENSVDYFIGSDLYVSYGQTMTEAINTMMTAMNNSDVPSGYRYLLVRPKVALNRADEVALAKQAQYVSTPSNIKGVVLTCQEMDYVAVVNDNASTPINGGNSFEEWISFAGPLGTTEGNERLFVQFGAGTTYYEITGDPYAENPTFTVKNGTPLTLTDINGMSVLTVDGVQYNKPECMVLDEYQLPELHVDATTEIHLVGSFMEYDNDQPSIFMNIPEDSEIKSIINGDEYTDANLGNIYTKDSVFRSWHSGDVQCTYTVKVDKLESKTVFTDGGDSDISSAKANVNADSLFNQLTDASSDLTAAEKTAVSDGKNITITLDVEAVDNTSSTELAAEVESEYSDSQVQYVDMELLYHVGFEGAADKNITETNEAVGVELELDPSFASAAYDYTVLREHNGNVEEISATYNRGTLSFGTDKFSSYAVVRTAPAVEKKYTIKYNGNGSTGGSMASQTVKVGTSVTLPSNAFTRKGYTFLGWATAPTASTAEYTNGETVLDLATENGATVNLYAVWQINNYSITYKNVDGATNTNPASYTVNSNKITLAKPVKTGYTFVGWYTNANFKTKAAPIAKGSIGDKIFYAKWTVNQYSVVFNKNGGTGSTKTMSCKYDTTYSLRANKFKRKGYVFDGWATSKNGGVVYANAAQISKLTDKNKGKITLYAHWTLIPYTYTYNLNAGGDPTATLGAAASGTYNVTQKITFAKPTRAGYTFKGWYTDSKCKKKLSYIKKGTIGDKTLYAKWQGNKYQVAFNANGGTGSMKAIKGTYATGKTLPACTMTKEGYSFAGWSTSAAGGVVYTDANDLAAFAKSSKAKKTTLYAVWTPDSNE